MSSKEVPEYPGQVGAVNWCRLDGNRCDYEADKARCGIRRRLVLVRQAAAKKKEANRLWGLAHTDFKRYESVCDRNMFG